MGEVKSKPNPKQVFDACVGGILEGLNQKQIIKTLDISKDTLKKKLAKKGTNWKELSGKNKVDSKVMVTQKVDFQRKVNTLYSQTPQPTPSGSIGGTSSFLPPELQSLLTVAKDIPSWLAPTIMDHYNRKYKIESRPDWFRPTVLYSKQNLICDYINDTPTQVIVIVGPRRTGKSTSWYVGVHEAIYEGIRKMWGLWGATERGAGKILTDAWKDSLTFKETRPLHVGKTFHKLSFFNGGEIEVNATTVTGSKGFAYQGVVMTEFDQILRDNPDAVAAIIGILRSEPTLKFIIDMNMGGGAYHLLMDKFRKDKYKTRVKVVELLTKDVEHFDEDTDELVSDIMECAMGEDYVQEQMLHIETHTGDAFNPKLIIEAMNTYDDFMAQLGKNKYVSCIGVDPGFSHPTGVSVCGVYRGHIFELEGLELRGKDVSEERIKALVAEMAHDYGSYIRCESNSGGLHWIKYWDEECGLNANSQNFSSNKLDLNSRAGMMRIVRLLLEEHRLHICSDRLRQELLIYNPDKDRNDSKGDLADAFIHSVFYLYNEYLDEDDSQVVFT